jgi:hypothetical protein
LNDWREKLKSLGGSVTEPTTTAIEVRKDPSKFNYMPLVYGAIAILTIFGLGYGLSKVASVGALFKKRTA